MIQHQPKIASAELAGGSPDDAKTKKIWSADDASEDGRIGGNTALAPMEMEMTRRFTPKAVALKIRKIIKSFIFRSRTQFFLI